MHTQTPMDTLRESKVIRILLSFVIVLSCASSLMTAAQDGAYAASSLVPSSVSYTKGNYIYYDNFYTHYFWCDDTIAYCANPELYAPDSGTYTTSSPATPSDSSASASWNVERIRAVLWYGYGGPGFDKNMFPSTWYDGTAMTNARYQVLTHIAVSFCWTRSTAQATYGCSDEFISYVRQYITGVVDGEVSYSDAFVQAAYAARGNLPSTDVFQTYAICSNSSSQQVVISYSYVEPGYLKITKSSSNTDITSGNSCYSLAGAVFTVYDSNGNKVATLTTNSNGTSNSLELPAATYTVKETTAPTGYAVTTSTWTVTIKSGETETLKVSDIPQSNPIDLLLAKIDAELAWNDNGNTPQGSATLARAEYVVEYYDGYYSTADAARESGTATRTWVFKTDENGYVYLSSDYLIKSTSDGVITSDSLYYDSSGSEALPLGTVVIYEYTAPEGYLLSDEAYVAQVTSEGSLEAVYTYNAPTEETALAEQVIRGGVEIYKRDIESDLSTGLGAASMEGTQFEIVTLNENDVVVDGITYSCADVVATLTIEDGYASTSDDLLPYGIYSIQEVYAGEGYLLNDTVYEFSIDEDGEIVTAGTSDGHIHDQVKRSDFEFSKKAENGSASLAGVAFKLRSVTTGESHVVVTDENGYFSSEASWNAHSSNTNGNDWVLDVDGIIDSSQLDATAGIWFGLTSEGNIVDVDDTLGALPYDTYLIEELRCTANEGYQLISTTMTISRDGAVIDLGTLDDPEAEISTTATDALDGDNYIDVGEVSITDKVSYSHLIAGSTYTVTGQLYDAETGEALIDSDGNEITSDVTFTAEKSYGSVNVEFRFASWDFAGKTLVVYETLTDANGSVIAEHKDQNDTSQQLTILTPKIETHATDGVDGDKNIIADTESVVVDTVNYCDLSPGETYVVTGTLMIKSYDEDGNVVEEELRVGTGETTYEVYDEITDTWLAYESIDSSDNPYYTFTIDEDKTLSVWKITYSENSEGAITSESFITASFAEDMWRETELTAPVTSTATFTPETSSGEIELTFTFDSTALSDGTELVVFERLYRDGIEVATHTDINDKNQTVSISNPENTPATSSTSSDSQTYDKTGGSNTVILSAIAALLALAAICACYYLYRRRVLSSQRALRKARAFETIALP